MCEITALKDMLFQDCALMAPQMCVLGVPCKFAARPKKILLGGEITAPKNMCFGVLCSHTRKEGCGMHLTVEPRAGNVPKRAIKKIGVCSYKENLQNLGLLGKGM